MINDETPMSEKLAMSSMLLNLAQAGVIFPDSDREWIRELLGLPEMEEGAVSPEWQLERSLNGQESASTAEQPAET